MIKIFPMGGIGGVTKNMFLYEYGDEMLVVDCGIGFPDENMPGVDFLIPDISYLQKRLEEGAKLNGIVLTHGHDDHIAALPYIVPEIKADFEIYGSPLTAEFAMSRMSDHGVEKQVHYFDDGELKLGSFRIETIRMTHSVPDTRHLVIHTPEGSIYHGSDFKLDLNPVDHVISDLQKVAEVGKKGIMCALIDCLRVERPNPTSSESVLEAALRREMYDVKGKVLVTLMSSNLHRVQQVINVAAEYGRKVTFVGRSIEQNVNTAMNMGILTFPANSKINKRNTENVRDEELCVIIAGSQGQPGSSLVRAVAGGHPIVSLKRNDKVIIASEPIPGSESNVYSLINEIALLGVEVAYSDIEDDLHVSGHASAYEQMLMLHLIQPDYVFPVGGEERHRVQFRLMMERHGLDEKAVVLPQYGKIVEFEKGTFKYGAKIELRERTVDNTGISSVMTNILDERANLGKSGALVVSLIERAGAFHEDDVRFAMKGFTFGDSVDPLKMESMLKQMAVQAALEHQGADSELKRTIEKALSGYLGKELGKSPAVVAVITSV